MAHPYAGRVGFSQLPVLPRPSSMSDDLPPLMPLVNSDSSSGSNNSSDPGTPFGTVIRRQPTPVTPSSITSPVPVTPAAVPPVTLITTITTTTTTTTTTSNSQSTTETKTIPDDRKRPEFYLIDKIIATELPSGERGVNQFSIGKRLGQGAFASVRLATDTNTGITYAVKKMSKASLRKKREFTAGPDGRMKMTNALEKVQREVEIMCQIWHPNVVPLFGVFDDPNEDTLYLVLELEEKGQIMNWDGRAMQYKSKHYPVSAAGGIHEDQLRPLLVGITHGLAALHAERIIHRDIKPDNVLLSAAGVPKLADFGTAKQFAADDVDGMVADSAGTFHFFSPESCSGESYSGYTTDVWALGVTLYCCVYGRVPWMSKDNNPQELFEKIQHQPWQPPDGAATSPPLHSLLSSLLEKDPTKRITLAGILNHPWVTAAK